MAGLTPAASTNYSPDQVDRLTFTIGDVTNGESVTIPANKQLITGPTRIRDGEINFRDGSSIKVL